MASLFARDDSACSVIRLLRIDGGRRNERCNWVMVNHIQRKLFASLLVAAALFSSMPGVKGQIYDEDGENMTGIIVGCVVGGIVLVAALIGGTLWWRYKKKQPAPGVEQKAKSAFGDPEAAHGSERHGPASPRLVEGTAVATAAAHPSEAHPSEAYPSEAYPSEGDGRAFLQHVHGTAVAYTIEPQKAVAKAANETDGRKTTSAAKESRSEVSQTVGTVAAGRRTGVVTSTARQFTYNDILSITGNFNRVIGKGGSATVYHGQLEEGGRSVDVAVKRMKESSSTFGNQFLAEVNIMVRIHHRNLVSLIGVCTERDEITLVSEYMAGGTLSNMLRARGYELTWSKRLQIAVDVAIGLEYLHTGCKPAVIHRDIKSANILLNENLEAKLADFGLSKAGAADGSECSIYQTIAKGTLGYLDPEYARTTTLTKKSDVYSFGVVLFELITGKPAIVVIGADETGNLNHWVMPKILSGDMDSLLDPLLKGKCNNIHSVWEVAGIARIATGHPDERPDMTRIVNTLKAALSMETSGADMALTSETSISQSFVQVPYHPVPR